MAYAPDSACTLREAEKRYRLHREEELAVTASGRTRATGRWKVRAVDLSGVVDCGFGGNVAGATRLAAPAALPLCVVHELEDHPGAFHVSGAFSSDEQARACARESSAIDNAPCS